MNRKVVYTALTDNHDTLPQYSALAPDYDYVCFTDCYPPGTRVGMWEVRSFGRKVANRVKQARYAKLNPHVLLPEYEVSVWMDANLSVVDGEFYRHVDALLAADSECLWWCNLHPWRDCIYQEAPECVRHRKDRLRNIYLEIKYLRLRGFPEHYGLYETSMMVRRHMDPVMIAADRLWWRMVRWFSKRDQLSHSYVLWECGIKPALLMEPGFNMRSHPWLKYSDHAPLRLTPKELLRREKGFEKDLKWLSRHRL